MLTCKGGKPIDNKRIQKYENLCHFLVRKFLPALNLYEASMNYEDLVNQCRYETMKALMNYDPVIAMKSFRVKKVLDKDGSPIILKVYKNGKIVYKTEPDLELRKSEEERKLKDPEKAMRKAEEGIVYGRIANYLRRTRWKYNEENAGGKTIRMGLMTGVVNSGKARSLDSLIDSLSENVFNEEDFFDTEENA